MREVKYVTHGYFGVECKNVGPIKDGLFHGFFQEGSNENGMEAVAIIETTIGECLSVGARQIKFINPPKSEQGDSKNSSQAVQQTHEAIPARDMLLWADGNLDKPQLKALFNWIMEQQ